MASSVGVSESTVRAHESTQNAIGPDMARRYAAVLGAKPEWLLYGPTAGGGPGTVEVSTSAAAPVLSESTALLAVRGLIASAERASPHEAAELKELAAWLTKRAFS